MTLKELRKKIGLTQQDVSRYVNIPLRTYKRIENETFDNHSIKYSFIYNKLENYKIDESSKKEIDRKHRNIAVIGGGYVGLANAIALSKNNNITVFDIDKLKIKYLKNNIDKIALDNNVKPYTNISIKTPKPGSYKKPSIFIIALPTNYDESLHSFDMSIVLNCYKQIRSENKTALIVIRSTCVPGFCESLNDKNVLFSPEFLVENKSIQDELNPSRVIVASDYKTSKVDYYLNLVKAYTNTDKYLVMKYREAECAKLFANAYLAMRVAYFNEVDNYALDNNVDTRNIINGICSDPRIGDYYNNPSFGYGGYCLPKDTQCIANEMKDSSFFNSITNSNVSRKEKIRNELIRIVNESKKDVFVIGIYSFANKANSNSLRNSVIADIINGIENDHIKVAVYDKNIESLNNFASRVDLILTNRITKALSPYIIKCFTRDLFKNN